MRLWHRVQSCGGGGGETLHVASLGGAAFGFADPSLPACLPTPPQSNFWGDSLARGDPSSAPQSSAALAASFLTSGGGGLPIRPPSLPPTPPSCPQGLPPHTHTHDHAPSRHSLLLRHRTQVTDKGRDSPHPISACVRRPLRLLPRPVLSQTRPLAAEIVLPKPRPRGTPPLLDRTKRSRARGRDIPVRGDCTNGCMGSPTWVRAKGGARRLVTGKDLEKGADWRVGQKRSVL